VMFTSRPRGTTLRRSLDALTNPHDSEERFDPDFPIAYRCEDCGRVGYGPRKHLSEALREHRQSDCPARRTKIDEPHVTRLLYPRL